MKNQSITVRIDSAKYDRLKQLAASMERSRSFVVEDAISNYLSVNEWQITEIKKALDKADDPKTQWVLQAEIEKKYLKQAER